MTEFGHQNFRGTKFFFEQVPKQCQNLKFMYGGKRLYHYNEDDFLFIFDC